MTLIPQDLRSRFRDAGWFEERTVAVDTAVPPDHPAHDILAELGGITLPQPAPNIEALAFGFVNEAAGSLHRLEAALRTKLVGVADQDGGHAELYVARGGQLIGCSLVHQALWLVGRTFADGMKAIIGGARAKPILLRGDPPTALFDRTFRYGDAETIGEDAPEFGPLA